MADEAFPNRFLMSGRLGFYLRVEREGTLRAGDEIELLERPAHSISIFRLWLTVFGPQQNAADTQLALDNLPFIDAGWRRRLRQVTSTGESV